MFTPRSTLLLFDLDGTLWDSAAAVAAAWNEVFQREDPSLPLLTVEDVHSVMGMTMQEIGQVLQPAFHSPRRKAVFDECCDYEVEYLHTHCGILYPDLRPVMETLKAQGYTLGIVSNCQTGYIDAFLTSSGTRDLFADYEEWGRTGRVKGENIRLVMDRLGFSRAVYSGDTRKDQEAALLAGIPFIHAAYGFGRAESPDGVIHFLRELPDAVARLNA